ncbi:sialin-like [Calliopsis andreniformis]|uniref:sialin-like n=1 Tax=Calliopsis andreniformis TaxID=337506 RepID=UPI003FCC717C
MSKKKEWLSCRDVLWYLVFCGFAINYMLRFNMNLTIIAMVIPRPKAVAYSECTVESASYNKTHDSNSTLDLSTTVAPILNNVTYEDRFSWNENQQGMVLGAYFWLHWLSQLPGGLLARRYGTKLVYGLGNFLTAILGFLIPFATYYHLNALIFLRVLQGLISGVIWPSMHNMTAKWIPPNERSRFVISYLGSSIGAAITFPFCAAISSTFGWAVAFHMTSLLGVIWFCFWIYFVHDSPQQHPRISNEEKKYILENIAESVDEEVTEIPWRHILLSGPVWFTTAAHWSAAWGFFTLMAEGPIYFNFIHGWNINTTGFLSGFPHVLRVLFSYYFSVMCDWLIRTKKMSVTNVRKSATFVATGLQGIILFFLGFSGCEPILAVVLLMSGLIVSAAITSSTFAIFLDLSPNYASVLLGFSGMIATWCGFLSPAVAGGLTNNNQTVGQWRIVFIIAAVNSLAGCVIYLLLGTSKEQWWNKYGKMNKENGQEMQKLTATSATKSGEGDEKIDVTYTKEMNDEK